MRAADKVYPLRIQTIRYILPASWRIQCDLSALLLKLEIIPFYFFSVQNFELLEMLSLQDFRKQQHSEATSFDLSHFCEYCILPL
jgi:hypothetical protein